MVNINVFQTACHNGAAKLARRQRGEKNCSPRKRVGKLEHRTARSQRDGKEVVVFAQFSLFLFYLLLLSALRATETGRVKVAT